MTSKVAMGVMPWAAGTFETPSARGPLYPHHGEVFGLQRLASDAIGTTIVTLTNVVTGSRFVSERISDDSLATPTANAEGVAAGSTVAITFDLYASGNSNNALRITIRNASGSPAYKEFVTQLTLQAGGVSVYCLQQPDE